MIEVVTCRLMVLKAELEHISRMVNLEGTSPTMISTVEKRLAYALRLAREIDRAAEVKP